MLASTYVLRVPFPNVYVPNFKLEDSRQRFSVFGGLRVGGLEVQRFGGSEVLSSRWFNIQTSKCYREFELFNRRLALMYDGRVEARTREQEYWNGLIYQNRKVKTEMRTWKWVQSSRGLKWNDEDKWRQKCDWGFPTLFGVQRAIVMHRRAREVLSGEPSSTVEVTQSHGLTEGITRVWIIRLNTIEGISPDRGENQREKSKVSLLPVSPYYTTLGCAQTHYLVCTDPMLRGPLTDSGCMYASYFTSAVTPEVKAERSLEIGAEWSSDLGVGWNLEQWEYEMGCPLTGTWSLGFWLV